MKNLYKRHKIATKFLTWFLLVALLPFCVVGYITYRIYEKSLTESVLNNLISIADNKAKQIMNYIIERGKNVVSLANIPAIVDAAKEYESAFKKKGKIPWRYSPEFIAVDKKYRPFLNYYKETFGFSDLFLISPHGDAVFSVMQGEDLGSNYYTGFYKDTELAKVYDRAKTLLETGVSDFEFYPATNEPAAFLAAPVLKRGMVVGVIVLQMNNEEVYKLVGDYSGLGETGETIIASKIGDKAVFLTPLRHDPHAAFRRRVAIGSKEDIPIQEAVQGKKGFGKYIDYRGTEVLGVWRYLPHFRWGMAVEMDVKEAFASIAEIRSSITAIGIITIFTVILLAVYISRTISEPIVKLTETTRLIAAGDFSKSVTISSKDELGQLAGSFNEMVKKLAEGTAERKRAEREKAAVEVELRQAQKMEAIGQLAGGVAHDFNNMLTGILGNAELLQMKLVNEPVLASHLEWIIAAASHSAKLTQQLLVFARKGQYQQVPVDIHRTIAEVAGILSNTTDPRISIRQHFQANLSVIMVDPTLLENAILNLGINACDAMPQGGCLTFSTKVVELDENFIKLRPYKIEPGCYLQVIVSDTGIGMSPEIKRHLFEPFFTTKEPGRGTGLGLAGVYGMIKSLGGIIEVCSETGHGTNVEFFLPLDETLMIEPQAEIPAKMQTGTGNVLLIDDEDVVRDMAAQVLEKYGYRVVSCQNGLEAAEYYQENLEKIDLVILDMTMPKMSGRETFLAMRTVNPQVRVLLSSGFSSDGEVQELLNIGAKGFLQKPYRVAELLAKVKKTIREPMFS